jgi:hypothetical protein
MIVMVKIQELFITGLLVLLLKPGC